MHIPFPLGILDEEYETVLEGFKQPATRRAQPCESLGDMLDDVLGIMESVCRSQLLGCFLEGSRFSLYSSPFMRVSNASLLG